MYTKKLLFILSGFMLFMLSACTGNDLFQNGKCSLMKMSLSNHSYSATTEDFSVVRLDSLENTVLLTVLFTFQPGLKPLQFVTSWSSPCRPQLVTICNQLTACFVWPQLVTICHQLAPTTPYNSSRR